MGGRLQTKMPSSRICRTHLICSNPLRIEKNYRRAIEQLTDTIGIFDRYHTSQGTDIRTLRTVEAYICFRHGYPQKTSSQMDFQVSFAKENKGIPLFFERKKELFSYSKKSSLLAMSKRKIIYFGLAIIVVILLFAFIYCGISSSIKNVDGFCSALYFSIVTITTLGFGEMYPLDGFARVVVCLEVLVGVVSVGVFLNSIAQAQAQRLQYFNEKAKLRQNYLLLSMLFEKYLQAAYCVVSPWEKQERCQELK